MGSSLRKNSQQHESKFEKVFGSEGVREVVQLNGGTVNKQPTIKTGSYKEYMLLEEFSWQPLTDELIRNFTESSSNPVEILESERCLVYTTTNETNQKFICRRWYFRERSEKDKHLSNILQLKELPSLHLYSELNDGSQDEYQFLEASLMAEGGTLEPASLGLSAKLAVLHFCGSHLLLLRNAVIDPQQIEEDCGSYHLTNVQVLSSHPSRLLLQEYNFELIVMWLFSLHPLKFQRLLETQQSALNICFIKELDMPLILKDVVLRRLNRQIDLEHALQLIEGISIRGPWLSFKMDTLHACLYYRGKQIKSTPRDWIFMKAENRVYFFHTTDKHPHICSLLRKRRKVDLEQCSVAFDEEECQLILQSGEQKNKQHLVRANEFELELHESISDITLYQKLPVVLQKASLYLSGKKLYILEKNMYQLELAKPRVIKELAKQICRHLHLLINSENGELYILQACRDIFKDGIRLWSKEGEVILYLAGSEEYVGQMNQIQMHLEDVLFCLEVFFNVFLMMAGDNIYVLDLNYKCFFSYASLNQVINYQENRQLHPNGYRYMFEILNQEFEVRFPSGQNSNSCVLKAGKLHILGVRGEEVLALVYSFEPLLGAIRLEQHRSLMYESPMMCIPARLRQRFQQAPHTLHKFLVDQEELFMYKYQGWRYESERFLQLHCVQIVPSRSSNEFHIYTEPVLWSLKQQMESLQQNNQYYSQREARLIVHRLVEIYQEILSKQITHRNLTARSLFFTADKVLKLVSWVEPARVEFVSDYKDFMMLVHNVLIGSQLEKLTTQVVESSISKYEGLEDVYKMTLKSIKMPVGKEVRTDLENNINKIRESLQRDLTKSLVARNPSLYVFNLLPGTHLMYMSSLHDHSSTKKVEVMQEDEPFIFENNYQTLWNQRLGVMYVLTDCRFYSIKLESESKKDKNELKVRIEDEQFLPATVRNSSLCLLAQRNLIYSFGGTETTKNGTVVLSKSVFVFDCMKLSWEEKPQLCYTLRGAAPVVGNDGRTIYLFGGISTEVDMLSNQLKFLVYDVDTASSKLMVDTSRTSPYLNCWNAPTVILFGNANGEGQVFAFYRRNDKEHHVRLLELAAGGFDFSFSIDQVDSEELVEVDPATKPPEKVLEHTIKPTSFSAKEKNIYHLDSTNRLLILSFKNIAQPFLEIVETPEARPA